MTLVVIDFALYFTQKRSSITKLVYPRFYFVKDSELGHDISPNFATTTHFFEDFSYPIWSNDLGCFDTDYVGETPYIYMAGDSLTWGFSPFDDMWGKRLETLLGMRTVKCGVTGGYGTKQELIKTKRSLSRLPSPNLIIVGYFEGNDVIEDANFPSNTVYNGYLVRNLAKDGVSQALAEEKYARFDKYCTIEILLHPIIQRTRCLLSNHSVLYNLVKKDIRKALISLFPQSTLINSGLIAREIVLPDARSETEYKKHLDNVLDFKKLAVEENSKLLFVLMSGENEKLKLFLDREEISYVDFHPIFEEYSKIKSLRWKINGHHNIDGNHLLGFVVSKFIIENDLVSVVNKTESLMMIDKGMKEEFNVALNN
ncbi:MAG: hypothetical protein AAB484_00490 [Patescibacteria group bacterium]